MDEPLPPPQLEAAARNERASVADRMVLGRGLDPFRAIDPARSIEPVKSIRLH